jgi:hypothetical protein
MANYLVVANQTLGGAELKEEIRKRLQDGDSAFYVVVPVTRPHDYPTTTGMEIGAGGSLPLVARATGSATSTPGVWRRPAGCCPPCRHRSRLRPTQPDVDRTGAGTWQRA